MSNGWFWYRIHFLKTLSSKKIINLAMLCISYVLSNALRKPLVVGSPAFLSIEPTNWCNLACPECPTGTKTSVLSKGYLSDKMAERISDQLCGNVISVNLFFQGEPFLHRSIVPLMSIFSSKTYLVVSTNGHFIDENVGRAIVASGVQELVFSVDGIDQQSYQQYRVNGSFDKVVSAIELVVRAKRKARCRHPRVVMQCLVFAHNEHSLCAMRQLAKRLGVDELTLKSVQFYNKDNAAKMLPSARFSRYSFDADGLLVIKSKLANRCWRVWTGAVITWDGKVLPCCFDKDATFSFGNIADFSLSRIWNSQKRISFLVSLLRARNKINICKNCSEGLKL